jgi:hypothetical protein
MAIEDLLEAGVLIVEAVHDDKTSVDGILTEYGIWSSKDLWHKCKSLCSKFKDDLIKARRTAIENSEEARASCDLQSKTVKKLQEYLKLQGLTMKERKDALVAKVWEVLDKKEELVEEDTRLLRFPELGKHGVADRMKTHIYTACKARAKSGDDNVGLLRLDILNAADHWSGNHDVCAQIDPTRKCVLEKRGVQNALYIARGETHLAVKAWLEKKCSLTKLKHYTRARLRELHV